MTELTHVEAIYIESDPFTSRSEPGVIDGEYAELPEEFLDVLVDLYANRDGRTCWRCNAMAGYVLAERPSGFEDIEWRPTGLAREGDGPVAVLCEDCSVYVPPSDARTAMDEVMS